MIRKTIMPLSILLLIAILSVLVGACGSETTQKEGGTQKKSGKAGGSAPQKNEQTGSAQGGSELTYIGREPKLVFGSSYVGPLTEIFGDVFIGQKDFIASNTILRAAPGNKVVLGNESNVQDNVTVRG